MKTKGIFLATATVLTMSFGLTGVAFAASAENAPAVPDVSSSTGEAGPQTSSPMMQQGDGMMAGAVPGAGKGMGAGGSSGMGGPGGMMGNGGGMMNGQMMTNGMFCAPLGAGLNPATAMQMRGEMMRAVGDIMIKYSKQAETSERK